MSTGIPREPKGAAPPGLTSDEGARREGGASRAPGGERDKQSAPEASGDNRASGKKLAFIGLGIMGAPMAANLVKAGFDVAGYNRSPARIEQLVAAGGRGAADIATAVRDADVVATMVPDSPDVQAVLAGEGGVFEHADRAVLGRGRLDPDPVHHRPGARGQAPQGGLPGREHLGHRRPADQDGDDRARSRPRCRAPSARPST